MPCVSLHPDCAGSEGSITQAAAWSVQAGRDATIAKSALFLLRRALPPAALRQPPWSTFLSLYELLDEIPLYLIEARPACPDFSLPQERVCACLSSRGEPPLDYAQL